MAHKKGLGSSVMAVTPRSALGTKRYAGQTVTTGTILSVSTARTSTG